MAHNLNFVNGKYSFASAKEKAWHGLGQIVDKAMTSSEAIVQGGLDYNIIKVATFIDKPVGETTVKIKTGVYSTVREDTFDVLGNVGERYTVVQNKEAFSFFDSIVGEGEAIYETVGALGKGETIFITAKMPDYIKVKNDDIEKYLLLVMSHNGKLAIQAFFTPVRVVCNNTLRAALCGSLTDEKVYVRHTKNASYELAEAHKILGISNRLSNELSNIFDNFSQKNVNTNGVNDFFEKLIYDDILSNIDEEKLSKQKENLFNDMLEYHENGVGQQNIIGTVWGLYNAVTGFYQNVKDFKSDDRKFQSLFLSTGVANKMNNKAFDLCLELSK